MYILNKKIQTNCLYGHYITLSILLIMWECNRMEGAVLFSANDFQGQLCLYS